MTDFEKRVDELVDTLGCSLKEAEEIIKADEEIDKGAKLFEQTAEQKQASKQYRQGERKPTVYKLDKRERKADEVKRGLIELFAEVLKEQPACVDLEVTNIERQIDFLWSGRRFRVVLSAPRK